MEEKGRRITRLMMHLYNILYSDDISEDDKSLLIGELKQRLDSYETENIKTVDLLEILKNDISKDHVKYYEELEKRLDNLIKEHEQAEKEQESRYHAFTTDEEWYSERFLNKLKEEDHVIYNGKGVFAVKINPIYIEGGEPGEIGYGFEILGEDDGHLFTHTGKMDFSATWAQFLIENLNLAIEYVKNNKDKLIPKEEKEQ